MTLIKQKYYETLDVDCREKDIVVIWMNTPTDSNVIHIERESLKELIEILQNELILQ